MRFLLKKLDAKSRLIRWMLLLQEFDIKIKDKKGNFIVAPKFPPKASRLYKEKIESDAKYYIWDDPYLWRLYSDQVIRRCIPDLEIESVLYFCHSASGDDHYGSTRIAQKVLDCGFY
ncbi:hypothetical protein CR513_35002, partial [Mucuna pruriens]